MDLFDVTQNALTAAMRGSTARQSALADNLANVDTPGYVRKDVDFHSALSQALDSGDSGLGDVSFTAQPDSTAAVRQDGNTVDVDQESAAMSQNALEYEALARVSATRIDILKSAMGVS